MRRVPHSTFCQRYFTILSVTLMPRTNFARHTVNLQYEVRCLKKSWNQG